MVVDIVVVLHVTLLIREVAILAEVVVDVVALAFEVVLVDRVTVQVVVVAVTVRLVEQVAVQVVMLVVISISVCNFFCQYSINPSTRKGHL